MERPPKARSLRARRLLLLTLAILALVSLHALPAAAAPDTYFIGDGHEGAVSVNSTSPLNYSAPLSANAALGALVVTTGPGQAGASGTNTTTGSADQAQFEPGRLALVIQSAGYSGPAPSGDQSAINLSGDQVGRWELARISSLSGTLSGGMTINFSEPLEHAYSSPGAQIVAVPEFTSVQIATGAGWLANPWDGTSGGVTAFLASGAVDLATSSSSITADAAGFRGGVLHNAAGMGCTQLDGTVGGGKGEGIVSGLYPGTDMTNASRGNVANAAGGGDCSNSGGGGGGNAGQGGKGGYAFDGVNRDVGGIGGARLIFSVFDRAVFGGGGGAGDENDGVGGAGGAGGGFLFVRAQSLTGSGVLSADGAPGAASANVPAGDGAGGGGAGGTVQLRFAGMASCSSVGARGGNGGNENSTAGVHGPGGGGAGGRLLLQASGGSCPTSTDNGVAGTAPNGPNGSRGAAPATPSDPSANGISEGFPGGGGFTEPVATVTGPANGRRVATTQPTISGSSSMASGTVLLAIDSAPPVAVTTAPDGSWSYTPSTPLSQGAHSYFVRGRLLGTVGPVGPTRSLTVDTTPPMITITSSSPPAGISPTFTFSSSEPLTTYECAIDGGPLVSCGSPFSAPAIAAGDHTLNVVAHDAAGNAAATVFAFEVDPIIQPGGGSDGSGDGTQAPTYCTAFDGAKVAPPAVAILDAHLKKRSVHLRVRSDQFVLVRVTLSAGKRRLARATVTRSAGTAAIELRLRKRLRSGRPYALAISAVGRSGARAAAGASLTLSGRKVTLTGSGTSVGAPVEAVASCEPSPNAERPRVKVVAARRTRAGSRAIKVALRSKDYALVSLRLVQSGLTAKQRLLILRPGRRLLTSARSSGKSSLMKGTATVELTAVGPDGGRSSALRRVRVR